MERAEQPIARQERQVGLLGAEKGRGRDDRGAGETPEAMDRKREAQEERKVKKKKLD